MTGGTLGHRPARGWCETVGLAERYHVISAIAG